MKEQYQGKKSRPTKSYEIYYDENLQRYVFEIDDTEALFPLWIKAPSVSPRELVITKNQKMHLR